MSSNGQQNLQVENKKKKKMKKKQEWALPPEKGAKAGPRRMA